MCCGLLFVVLLVLSCFCLFVVVVWCGVLFVVRWLVDSCLPFVVCLLVVVWWLCVVIVCVILCLLYVVSCVLSFGVVVCRLLCVV